MHLSKGNEEVGLEFLGNYVSHAWYYENVPAQFNEAKLSIWPRVLGPPEYLGEAIYPILSVGRN